MSAKTEYIHLNFDYLDTSFFAKEYFSFFLSHKHCTIVTKITKFPSLRLTSIPKEYSQILTLLNIPLTGNFIHIGANTISISDLKSKKLYRCSFNNQGNLNVLRNAKFIRRQYLLHSPHTLETVLNSPYRITKEQLLPGATLPPSKWRPRHVQLVAESLKSLHMATQATSNLDLTSELRDLHNLAVSLSTDDQKKLSILSEKIISLHKDTKTKVRKAVIHGDLTFRNILFYHGEPFFIDFDRSSTTFPEFDYFLLDIDLDTYRQPLVSYKIFFDKAVEKLLFTHEQSSMLPLNVRKEWQKYPKSVQMSISLIFIYKMLILTLYNIPLESERLALIQHIYSKIAKL